MAEGGKLEPSVQTSEHNEVLQTVVNGVNALPDSLECAWAELRGWLLKKHKVVMNTS